ncbi:MAG: dicarboxylate/amino acid:cation symporter [Rikenellaceae bacterium]
MSKKKKIGLLPRIILAILLGVACSLLFPDWLVRVFATINGIFANFLSFSIPLIIIGLVAPGITKLGDGAGRLLATTALIAYLSTLFAGFLAYGTASAIFPYILGQQSSVFDSILLIESAQYTPFFVVEMQPIMSVMSALLISFVLGIGLANAKGEHFKGVLYEFNHVIEKLISTIIIPLLPLFIFGIFLIMGAQGKVVTIMSVFIKVLALVIVMQIVVILLQFTLAGAIAKKNPIKAIKTMLTAYVTALGTQSSAATIPITMQQSIKNGVREEIAGFVIPLCATIHLAGSTMMITTCSMAVMILSGMPFNISIYAGFIIMLGITMIAAPGVPGGAVVAALGVLQSILGFDETMQALMIALYITMDSFGTACNVTGDGAIALIVNKLSKKGKTQTA